ncbi:type ISP restriction/modification enzyme [Helicobacter sp. 13S00477-4]|uniref:type ISP restriction/modification enzyme n=1 Tax=Helicobacter sp. 13S00477-4 TaxID=1905759 RepID=UPI000BA79751|nr:type ISP restriction/modification enzyme [Helicobacter sp. 13S00477-4]PAF52763.1 hypothetical protein BKH44_00845 [Helicobacter sp. 13S00477-4]
MIEHIRDYLVAINDISLQSSEYQKRGALENFLKAFAPEGVVIKHEPPRDKSENKAGSPDFLILKDSLTLGYVENKRVNADLEAVAKSPQIAKYLTLSDNILLTDYLRFCLIRADSKGSACIIKEVRLCSLNEINATIKAFQKSSLSQNIEQISKDIDELFNLFYCYQLKPIATSIQFANSLALRTRLLRDFLYDYSSNSKISSLYETFKQGLYKELEFYDFCDSFAQTLTYSLFLAKLNNTSGKEIDLYNVKKFIPHSFPLLRALSGFLENLDDLKDLQWLLQEILNITNHIDITAIIKELNQLGEKDEFGIVHKDPYLHFYETFLAQYDPKLRELRGVYYTPAAVVDFIINGIDEVLREDFGESKGLGSALKKESNITLLDFATGTGTFLLEAFRKALSSEPRNSAYFEPARLIERFKGFEFLIAPYTIAHLKLSQTLKEEFGYEVGAKNEEERLKIFLNNTLSIDDVGTDEKSATQLFSEYELALETKSAQRVKNEPILVITGNPPYNYTSVNIYEKVRDYYDFGVDKNGKPIKEKNSRGLLDDYVKFIRFAEDKIESQKSGVIGIITNHGFLDNPTFRGMRKHLLNSFDKMYLIDLHGNAKKKEKCPDGSIDQNVFDIQQGVSISIFVKKNSADNAPPPPLESKNTEVYHYDLFGKRDSKYDFLYANTLSSIAWNKLNPQEPFYVFVPKNEALKKEYEQGWGIKDIFRISGTGIYTNRDQVVLHKTKKQIEQLVYDFCKMEKDEIVKKYDIDKDSRDWQIQRAIDSVRKSEQDGSGLICQVHYRPFDFRWTYFNGKCRGFMAYPKEEIMEHFLQDKNKALLFSRQAVIKDEGFNSTFVSDRLVDYNSIAGGGASISPLYLHNTPDAKKSLKKQSKQPDEHLFKDDKTFESDPFEGKDRIENFTPEFRDFIDKKYGEHFSPEVVLGYIYAILFHKAYREKYLDFLKNDFPKIPFSDSKEKFLKLSQLGCELIELHLGGGGNI